MSDNQYEYEHDVPPVRPEPPQDVKTKCEGGPWAGASITHAPTDWRIHATNGGHYEYDGVKDLYVFKANGF